MIVVINRITCSSAEGARHVESRFRDRMKAVDRRAGFLSFELWREAEDPLVLSSVTRWRCRADFDAWVGSPEFKAAHERHRQSHGGGSGLSSQVTVHEVVEG